MVARARKTSAAWCTSSSPAYAPADHSLGLDYSPGMAFLTDQIAAAQLQ
jgi:hypothetical protein